MLKQAQELILGEMQLSLGTSREHVETRIQQYDEIKQRDTNKSNSPNSHLILNDQMGVLFRPK